MEQSSLKMKICMVFLAVLLLLVAEQTSYASETQNGRPIWEFTGAYLNYSTNISSSGYSSSSNNSTMFQNFLITSVNRESYNFTVRSGPGNYSSVSENLSAPGNSSSIVTSRYSYATLYVAIFPAVNSSVLRDMSRGYAPLYINNGRNGSYAPLNISNVTVNYRGIALKAYKGTAHAYVSSNLSYKVAIYISAVSGIELRSFINSTWAGAVGIGGYFAFNTTLKSTNIPVGEINLTLELVVVLVIIVAVVLAAITVIRLRNRPVSPSKKG